MPFVKLDCGILNSTLWFEREAREVFITALLMAEPIELKEPAQQIAIGSLDETGWSVPPGWYGFVPAASIGIIHRAGVSESAGMEALRRLGEPEDSSRSKDFSGRRLVRVDGGFIVLNFMKYRERDYTAAERSRRYRERKASRRNIVTSRRDITQAEAEVKRTPAIHPSVVREGVQGEGPRLPANPLIEGRRPAMERQCYALIREISELEPNRDPTEILIEAAGWKDREGNQRSKVRLETMTDDHLIRTLHDLKSILESAKEGHAKAAASVQRQS